VFHSWRKIMRSTRSARLCSLFRPVSLIGLLALVALGCGGKGDASGTVTYKGKPLAFGTVLFEGSDGNLRQGNIGPDGGYSVAGVSTGEARVAVNSPNPKTITLISRTETEKPQSYPDVPGWFAIPKQYGTPAKSGLTYKIKAGANKIDIELQ
jgi:hypothetical protein